MSAESNIVVIGASGGIGAAFCELLSQRPGDGVVHALSRNAPALELTNIRASDIDLTSEFSIESAARRIHAYGPIDMVLVATGMLHRYDLQPEKRLAELRADHMAELFAINTIGPALIAKHFLPLLRRTGKTVFAALSARVGSIADNRLGGWMSYRTSKAALNMVLKTASIEHARRWPDSVVVGLHPGTVATALSAPFQSGVPQGKLFTPQQAAHQLLDVIESLTPADTGGFYAWDGKPIAF